MTRREGGLVDRLIHRRALRRWERVASEAGTLDPPSLRALRREARELRSRLDRALQLAEGRIALPGGGVAEMELPLHADWAWRPDPWRVPMARAGIVAPPPGSDIGPSVKLFHDCPLAEIILRQARAVGPADRAPFALTLEVFRFAGTFLSIVLDLPEAVARSLRLRHVVGVALRARSERPADVLARLNLRHGPNEEQLVQTIPLGGEGGQAEFDLAYTKVNEKRIDAAWVDLILGYPEMNRFSLADVVLTRRPRAEL